MREKVTITERMRMDDTKRNGINREVVKCDSATLRIIIKKKKGTKKMLFSILTHVFS